MGAVNDHGTVVLLAVFRRTIVVRQGQGPERVRMAHVEKLMGALSERDWAIIETVDRVRLVSGVQVERLHFSELAGRSRSVMRWRVLKRLVDARILVPFDRRIGTSHHGSDKLCYTLDSAGQWLMRLQAKRGLPAKRRRPRIPGERFIEHALAVTELYVSLVEHSRLGWLVLEDFQVEAVAYWPNGLGGWIKPDAFVKLRRGEVTDYWWYEADRATEDLPTIRGKLLTYLDFVNRGQLGPDGIMPRVIFGVPTIKRHRDVLLEMNSLPVAVDHLFRVTRMSEVVDVLADELFKQ